MNSQQPTTSPRFSGALECNAPADANDSRRYRAINAELERIALGLENARTDEEYGQLYAAQQALWWALSAGNDNAPCAAPFDVITSGRASRVTGTPASSEDCSADRRQLPS